MSNHGGQLQLQLLLKEVN